MKNRLPTRSLLVLSVRRCATRHAFQCHASLEVWTSERFDLTMRHHEQTSHPEPCIIDHCSPVFLQSARCSGGRSSLHSSKASMEQARNPRLGEPCRAEIHDFGHACHRWTSRRVARRCIAEAGKRRTSRCSDRDRGAKDFLERSIVNKQLRAASGSSFEWRAICFSKLGPANSVFCGGRDRHDSNTSHGKQAR